MTSPNLRIGQLEIENHREKLIGPGKVIEGTMVNCSCPYCGENNDFVTDGVLVEHHRETTFEKPCQHCGKLIFYKAKYVVKITAKAPELDKFVESREGASSIE